VHSGGLGYDYLHGALDDRTRITDVEVLPDERDATCAEFLCRAVTWSVAQNQDLDLFWRCRSGPQNHPAWDSWSAIYISRGAPPDHAGLQRRSSRSRPWPASSGTHKEAERHGRDHA
jgi:hypothetical protein